MRGAEPPRVCFLIEKVELHRFVKRTKDDYAVLTHIRCSKILIIIVTTNTNGLRTLACPHPLWALDSLIDDI